MNAIPDKLYQYAGQSIDAVIASLNSSLKQGLSEKETHTRRSAYGPNNMPSQAIHAFTLFLKQLRSPFIIMFFVLALLALLLQEYMNGIFMGTSIFINIIITWFQEYKSVSYLQSLNRYLLAQVYTLRDGSMKQVSSEQLVPGDIIFLKQGDIIPADVRFVEAHHVTVDQSVITGESTPIEKDARPITLNTLYDARNIGFMSTSLVTGQATALIIATGRDTIIGHTIASTSIIKESHFLHTIRIFSYYLSAAIMIAISILLSISLLLKAHTNFFDLFIFAIALTISITPEALPAIITFTLSKAMHNLLLEKVIVKQFTALQDLGSIDILCVDKTGTLTEHEQHLDNVTPYDHQDPLLLAAYIHNIPPAQDFDETILQTLSADQRKELNQASRIFIREFDSKRRCAFGVIKQKEHTEYLCIARGAFDEIIKLCSPLPSADYQTYSNMNTQKSSEGKRVLAVAYKYAHEQHDWQQEEHSLHFAGLLSFSDPIKKSSLQALSIAQKLGITIKMLSGDNKEVCSYIAKNLGLISTDNEVITGEIYNTMKDDEKNHIVSRAAVFAHMLPEQKLDILTRLQLKHTVGYVGDGINDIPTLQIAHVAITVSNANDIVRQAADIILLKKSLMLIIKSIQESRILFANIRKYLVITMASNFGNFCALVISSFIVPYLPMLPVHIILINLLADFPMLAIATDRVDIEDLKQPQELHIPHLLRIITLFAALSTACDLIYFLLFKGFGQQTLQTGWFVLSILTEIALIFSLRSKSFFAQTTRPSWTLTAFAIISALTACILPYSSPGATYFSMKALTFMQMCLIMLLTISYVVINELAKQLLKHKAQLFD